MNHCCIITGWGAVKGTGWESATGIAGGWYCGRGLTTGGRNCSGGGYGEFG